MTDEYQRKNRLEVTSEHNGKKITIAIESDIVPPLDLLKDIIKVLTPHD